MHTTKNSRATQDSFGAFGQGMMAGSEWAALFMLAETMVWCFWPEPDG